MFAVKALMTATIACALLAFAGCGDDASSEEGAQTTAAIPIESAAEAAKRGKPKVTVPDGAPPVELVENELIEGTGAEAKAGDEVIVHYVGALYKGGKEIDASWNREPFSFQLGGGQVISGWEEGIKGMKAGGRRELVIPSDLAYGEAGFPPAIDPNEPLVFIIDLVSIN